MKEQLDNIENKLDTLHLKLYGEDGYKGDITEIKEHLDGINGNLEQHHQHLHKHDIQLDRHSRNWGILKFVLWKVTLPTSAVGGLVAALLQALT